MYADWEYGMKVAALAHVLECSRSIICRWRWREFAKSTKENNSTNARKNRPIVSSIHPNIVSGAADIFSRGESWRNRGETLLSKVNMTSS
jgi:uncharacterized protein YjcR